MIIRLRRSRVAACLLTLAFAACHKAPETSATGNSGTGSTRGPLAGIQEQIDAGDLDAAIARLDATDDSAGPERFYLLGEAWAKKAESAPLPTPQPPPEGSPKGAPMLLPELKPEERKALAFFEKAAAAMPYDAHAQMGLADLLAPHARRRHDAQIAAAAKKPTPHGKHAIAEHPAIVPAPGGPDSSPERIIKAYRAAAAASAKDTTALEALYTFAIAVERLDDADWARKEVIARDRENPAPLVRYGDFLANVKKMPEEGMAQYRQALLWSPDDKAIKAKIAEIYIAQGLAHYQQTEWASADADYQNALKWADPDQAQRIQHELDRLSQVRRR
jgi:tetratricopeptide (TPR) repeat protein